MRERCNPRIARARLIFIKDVFIGDRWLFNRREDGTWYDPKTGKDCDVKSLNELLREIDNEESGG